MIDKSLPEITIIDVIEFDHCGMHLRADVIGGGISPKHGVFLTVMITDQLFNGKRFPTAQDDTAFKIAVSRVFEGTVNHEKV